MLDFVFNNFTTGTEYGARFFKDILQKALDELGLGGKKIELSVNLVGEGRIKALNKKYRNKNKATDVLSFPLHSRGGIMALGDIFICLPIAKKSASKEGRVLASELALLAVHGLLHLLGYDHEKTVREAKEMLELQDKILSKISF